MRPGEVDPMELQVPIRSCLWPPSSGDALLWLRSATLLGASFRGLPPAQPFEMQGRLACYIQMPQNSSDLRS
ncbi:hypothetical protein GOP47_0010773 [Adiantum capillus-veneris]|uniref:Uncharacterized protein n=1 Tax=Adiantum capillus-veneris TaxID=13818 RepID=A0A9D4ZI47_ADICA|nr:hypothetical protein GOP47_0010773 [Adiantum capillus-veneris]